MNKRLLEGPPCPNDLWAVELIEHRFRKFGTGPKHSVFIFDTQTLAESFFVCDRISAFLAAHPKNQAHLWGL